MVFKMLCACALCACVCALSMFGETFLNQGHISFFYFCVEEYILASYIEELTQAISCYKEYI